MTGSSVSGVITPEIEARVESAMRSVVQVIEETSPLLAGMAGYHLGWLDQQLQPIASGSVDRGKQIRPRIALLSAAAISGSASSAISIAAAIELLHNFTLIHDDVQDASPLRRHRETVWAIWGIGQAINAGDALFAASHRLVLQSALKGVPPETVILLADAFDRMTIEIVAGQVMDLQFEAGAPVSIDDYLQMIGRKTAAIVEFAAWAGALSAGAGAGVTSHLARFGRALGIGFQIRDDVLGIWGAVSETGKAAADDIRRKKQSLPVILLRQSLRGDDLEALSAIYANPEIDAAGIDAVLALMSQNGIRQRAEALVQQYHDRAESELGAIRDRCDPSAIGGLSALVAALSTRVR